MGLMGFPDIHMTANVAGRKRKLFNHEDMAYEKRESTRY